MSRRLSRDRQTIVRRTLSRRNGKLQRSRFPSHRRLRFEPLEDRRLLAAITVDTLVDGIGVPGTSLREAIAAANPSDTINFSVTGTINLSNLGQLAINKNLTINGPGAHLLTINAFDPTANDADGSRVFVVDDFTTAQRSVAISGLTITGGDFFASGGGIGNWENLTLTSCVITGNAAVNGLGGGIYTYGSTLSLVDCTVSGNTAIFGGGIRNSGGGTVIVTDSKVTDNTATDDGGGIQSNLGTVTVTRSIISGNQATNSAGGLQGGSATLNVIDSTISNNTSTEYGGGIWTYEGTVTVTGSRITGNSALSGGGILNTYGNVTVTRSTIHDNYASGAGGGVFNYFGQMTITRSTISANRADGRGGGIFSQTNLSGLTTTITSSTISGNACVTAQGGGGIMNSSGLTVIQNSTIAENLAGFLGAGSGVASQGDAATITRVSSSIIARNSGFGGTSVEFVGGAINSFESLGYNLIGNGNAIGDFNQAGDQTSVVNPFLGPLADNGGSTQTMALLPGSPAIDTGNPGVVFNPAEFDQRNGPFVRVFNGDGVGGARIDIGAYERQNFGSPQVLVVDILSDDNDGNYEAGDLSLREALGLANGNVGISETVDFHGALNGGTIVLTRGDLWMTDPVWINGPGADLLTIDASGSDPTANTKNADGSRVISINDGINGFMSATVSGVTLTGGDSGNYGGGGGINNKENLTISGVTIRDNATGSDGGGISHLYGGTLSVFDSTISGNSAGDSGGGIYGRTDLSGTRNVTISNSTISGNTAQSRGGGVDNGGGLTVINHSTITNNVSVYSQGGGVSSDGSNSTRTEVRSTIIAGNTGNDVNFALGAVNSFQSNGYNLIGTGNAVGDFNQAGDQTGVTNPMLAPLANHGGRTLTHAVLPGSPALDAGNPAFAAPPTNDQRGAPFVRVFGGDGAGGAWIDIGAYERQTLPGLNLVVDTLVDENDGSYTAGDLSLREAVLLANGSVGANTITFGPSLAGGTILLKAGELWVTDAVTITGIGASLLTIDASASDPTPNVNNSDGSRVFRIDDRIFDAFFAASISGLTLTGGDADFRGGGAIVTDENLTVTDCIITNNAAVGNFGGGIRADRAPNLTVTGTTISGNTAAQGGGISSGTSNALFLSNSTVSGNTATVHGGGVYHNANVTWSITDSIISGNTAAVAGGGVYGRRGHLYLTFSTVSGNTAAYGAGVFQQLNFLTVRNTTISGNQSPHTNGGGISVASATLNVHNSTISGNSSGSGGGILSYFSTTSISSSTITNNYGSFAGGGINVTGPGTTTLSHTIVAGNTGVGGTRSDISGAVTASYTLIGDNSGAVITNNGGNQIGTSGASINPLLGPLADNGGFTLTHALLPGSPAIDTGHPVFIPFPNEDQRGVPFVRVADGDGIGGARVDLGALEVQPAPPPLLPGDYNHDGQADAADYVVWRNTLGSNVTPFSGADGDGDGTIDSDDYGVWRAHFGQTIAAGSGELATASLRQGAGSGAVVASVEPVARASQPPALPGVRAVQTPTIVSTQTIATLQTKPSAEPGAVGPDHVAARIVELASPRRENHALRPRLSDVPLKSRDEALLAWLASRTLEVDVQDNVELECFASDEISDDSPKSLVNVVDALFERFVVDL